MERVGEGGDEARIRTHPHAVHFAGAASWVVFVAIVATLIIRHNELSTSTNWMIVGWAVVAAAAGLVGPGTRWARTWVEIDDPVARCTSGLLWTSTVDVDLERARALEIDRGLMGQWLGYGRLRIVDETGATHVFPPVSETALRTAVARRERRSRGRRGDRRGG
jgi:uncharacterized membrane protein YdbT with pleckstrin-like domain